MTLACEALLTGYRNLLIVMAVRHLAAFLPAPLLAVALLQLGPES